MILFVSSCKREVCSSEAGAEVRCYFAPYGQYDYVAYCAKKDVPPCDCRDQSGNLRDISTIFEQPCNGCVLSPTCDGASGGGTGLISEPYEFRNNCLTGSDDICPEFSVYYLDLYKTNASTLTMDERIRPAYFQFAISNFDISNFNYEFAITRSTGELVESKILTSATYSTLLRSANPQDGCLGKSCNLTGVIKASLSKATAGSHNIHIYQIDKASGTRMGSALSMRGFRVEDIDGSSRERVMNVTFHKTKSYDIANYQDQMRSFADYVNYVFGEPNCNLRFNINQPAAVLGSPFVDGEDNLMLDKADFSTGDLSIDISRAIEQWVKKIYVQDYMDQPNRGISLEAFFINKYDFAVTPPVETDPFFYSSASFAFDSQGVTVSQRSSFDYYNGSIVFRSNVARAIDEAKFNEEQQSVVTMLHEMGHMWSNAGFDGSITPDPTTCLSHSAFCTGTNKYSCLWQAACIGKGINGNPISVDDYLKNRVEKPTFCEGHQQIFMNRLMSRN